MPLIVSRDKYGNITGGRTEDWSSGRITDVVMMDIAEIEAIVNIPVEPVANMWMQLAAAPPPTPWVEATAPAVIEKLSFQTQDPRSRVDVCSLLGIVPGLGAWLGTACRLMDMVGLAEGVAGFFASFRKKMFALYFGRKLLGLMAQEGLDEFMKSTKRDVRDRIRIRRSA